MIAIQCRCGVGVAKGGEAVGISEIPDSLRRLFQGAIFCSEKCALEFCNECREIVESLETPEARSLVTGLHELQRDISQTLARMLPG